MALGFGKLMSLVSGDEFQKTVEEIVSETAALKHDREGLKAALPRAFAHYNARLDRIERVLFALAAKLDVDRAALDCATGAIPTPQPSNSEAQSHE